MASLTVYPDPSTGATTVDGRLTSDNDPNGVTFATVHDATTGTGAPATAATGGSPLLYSTAINADKWNAIYRGAYFFSTSALGASASISAAVFSLYPNSSHTSALGGVMEIDRINTSSANNNLATSDYNVANFDSVRQATGIAFASLATGGAYNNFTLNATGISNINKTGITKFGTRISFDLDNSAPAWSANKGSGSNHYYADQPGTTTDPKLVITYTTGAVTPRSTLTLMGVG